MAVNPDAPIYNIGHFDNFGSAAVYQQNLIEFISTFSGDFSDQQAEIDDLQVQITSNDDDIQTINLSLFDIKSGEFWNNSSVSTNADWSFGTVLGNGAIPTGGTVGQTILKSDATDYNYDWGDLTASTGLVRVLNDFRHDDTSSISNQTFTGAEVVSAATYDTFGHAQTFTKRTLTPSDIGAEPAFSKNTAFNKNFGTIAGTVLEGDTTLADLGGQPLDATLTTIAATNPTADQINYFTALNVASVTSLTAFGRSLIDDANAGAARTTLGLVIGTDVQAFSAVLDATTASFLIADETKLDFISVTQAVDLDTMESDISTNNAKVSNVTTDLSYTAITRTVASSDGTDAVITEVVAAGNSGLLTGADKTKLDGITASADPTGTLDDLTNVTITANTSGELLKWTGSVWINNTLSEAGVEPAFSKNTAFNKNFGTISGTVLEGDTIISLTSQVSGVLPLANGGTNDAAVTVANIDHLKSTNQDLSTTSNMNFATGAFTGIVKSGTSSSNGFTFFEVGSINLSTMGASFSAGDLVLGQGVRVDGSVSADYDSTVSFNFGRSAIRLGNGTIKLQTASATVTAIGSAVTLVDAITIDSSQNVTTGGTVKVNGTSAIITSGSGSPEGVVTAVIGSRFSRTDGGTGTSLYVKESGTGNTGWVAK